MPLHPLHNEKELFRQVAAGNEIAFRQLVHEYNARLFPFICRVVKRETIAEEIVQEVFLRLWLNREELAAMEQPVSWLFRVASNLSLSHLRRIAAEARKLHQLEKRQEPLINNNEVTDQLAGKELEALVEKAVALLPPKRRQIYVLSRREGLNHKEIANQLELSQNTVKNQLVISLKFIKEYIERESGLPVSLLTLLAVLP